MCACETGCHHVAHDLQLQMYTLAHTYVYQRCPALLAKQQVV